MIMTVAHLTSELSGGAGVAAQRLHDALRREGVDSRLYYESGLPLVTGCQRVFENQSFTRRNLAALAQAWRNRRNAPGCLFISIRTFICILAKNGIPRTLLRRQSRFWAINLLMPTRQKQTERRN